MSDTGTCLPCDPYQRAQADGTCGPDKCTAREKLLDSGKCEKCPAHEAVAGDKKELCVKPTCDKRQRIDEDGTCIDCGKHQKANATGLKCETPTCEARDKISAEGECVKCEAFSVPDADKHECVTPVHTER